MGGEGGEVNGSDSEHDLVEELVNHYIYEKKL